MSKSFKTFLKHTAKDFHNQSVNPPVVRASTIIFKSMKDIRKTQFKAKKNPIGGFYDYGRQGTSTTYILQKILTKLEESYHVFTTPTGFGAVFFLSGVWVTFDQRRPKPLHKPKNTKKNQKLPRKKNQKKQKSQ